MFAFIKLVSFLRWQKKCLLILISIAWDRLLNTNKIWYIFVQFKYEWSCWHYCCQAGMVHGRRTGIESGSFIHQSSIFITHDSRAFVTLPDHFDRMQCSSSFLVKYRKPMYMYLLRQFHSLSHSLILFIHSVSFIHKRETWTRFYFDVKCKWMSMLSSYIYCVGGSLFCLRSFNPSQQRWLLRKCGIFTTKNSVMTFCSLLTLHWISAAKSFHQCEAYSLKPGKQLDVSFCDFIIPISFGFFNFFWELTRRHTIMNNRRVKGLERKYPDFLFILLGGLLLLEICNKLGFRTSAFNNLWIAKWVLLRMRIFWAWEYLSVLSLNANCISGGVYITHDLTMILLDLLSRY